MCCWRQPDRNCDRQTSTITKVIDDTAHSFASAPSWTRAIVADGHNFFCGKAIAQLCVAHRSTALPRRALSLSYIDLCLCRSCYADQSGTP